LEIIVALVWRREGEEESAGCEKIQDFFIREVSQVNRCLKLALKQKEDFYDD